MSMKVVHPKEKPLGVKSFSLDKEKVQEVQQLASIFPLYFVDKTLTKSENVIRPVNYGRCPETLFGGVY